MPGDSSYRDHADQYATSSFPEADTTPFMVAYPEDVNDIQAALAFAISKNKKVVARSGGHQYCAKSSGGQSTIVLAMDTFDQFHQIDANTVDVGPAVRLTVLAARFEELEITIPHGECPLVNIGGHGQTGGYGHLARSFGLALDHIIALTIVLADGSVRTLHRPTGAPVTDDDKLFWGVLGGNAGSFGIVTNYRIRCIRDSDHPHSYGFKATRRYNQNRFADLMKQVQSWTQGVAAGVPRKGQDFMMTVESSSVGNLLPILLVELVHANLGGSVEHVDGDAVFQPIIQAAGQGFVYALLTSSGPWELSALSNAFVRRYPTTTLHGREFRFPYKKRVNCTSAALTDAFVTKLVNLVEKVVNHTNDVYLVFQMVIGGGALQNSLRRPETSIPRRDMVYCFVFDLFYDEGAEHKAEQLQQEMQEIIEAHFSPGQEQRLFWGSFGDTDMSKPQVRDYYYDDPAAYAQLRQLKQQVDPHDLFHTSFTVQ